MSYLIDTLHSDHSNISRLLDVLTVQLENIEKGEFTDFKMLADIMRYFTNYPDVHHHPMEDLVFKRLKELDDSALEMINEIYKEHQTMAEDSLDIYEKFKQLQGNAILSREEIVKQLETYISIYREHIRKEEEFLFNRAVQLFSESDWKKLEAEFEFFDDPLFGPAIDEDYRSLFNSIIS